MNLKVYEKTRYQNIYRHKKNKNYSVQISKPVKTNISRIDGKPITTIEEALKIRDNISIKKQKGIETLHKENFDILWDAYINDCRVIKKQAFNTIRRKVKDYNRYLKGKIEIPLSKTSKEFWANYINELECSNKQKNSIIKTVKAFCNWCINDKECLLYNPINKVELYPVTKSEMLFWNPEEIKDFFTTMNSEIENDIFFNKKISYRVKILAVICFNLGDRIGETRALTFGCFNEKKDQVKILHSINYDIHDPDYLSNTKNYQSQRVIDVSHRLIEEVKEYKLFLLNECGYDVTDDTIIFWNWEKNKPYSDVALRKQFYKYCDKANVTRIRMYDLRHTYAATMMGEGKKEYLFSKRMGHKNISTTINKYGHLSNEVRKEIAQTTDKYY